MKEPTISSWQIGSGKNKRWVCQVRVRPLGQKPISVHRRHVHKTVAYERAMEAFRALTFAKETPDQLAVNEALQRYLRALEGTIKATTIGEYAYQLDKYFCQQFGQRTLTDLSADEIRTHLKSLLARGLSVSTVNTIRVRINGLFNFAMREQLVTKNPAALVKPFRKDAGKSSLVQAPWSVSETRTALIAAEASPLHLFLALCLFTGLRRGEVTALTWGDFDEANRLIMVTKSVVASRAWTNGKLTTGSYLQEPKTEASKRSVFCSDELLKAIYKARRRFVEISGRMPEVTDPLVFHSEGASYSPGSITHQFARFCKENGLRKIRVHDLRHTSAVLALEAGIPLEAVSEGLGHSGVEITKRIYAPKVPGLGRRFAVQLEQFLVTSPEDPAKSLELVNHHA